VKVATDTEESPFGIFYDLAVVKRDITIFPLNEIIFGSTTNSTTFTRRQTNYGGLVSSDETRAFVPLNFEHFYLDPATSTAQQIPGLFYAYASRDTLMQVCVNSVTPNSGNFTNTNNEWTIALSDSAPTWRDDSTKTILSMSVQEHVVMTAW
jgi:hypothetical protein